MLVHVLPQAAVVPVNSAQGNHGFVAAKSLQVIDTADGALQPLPFFVSADIIIQGGDGVDIEGLLGCVGHVFGQLAARCLVEGTRREGEGYDDEGMMDLHFQLSIFNFQLSKLYA